MSAKKILVADDEPMIRKTLRLRLASEGFEVLEAADGAEVIEIAKTQRPDLIILDILMPHMNGVEASIALKQDKTTSDIPVIFLTALVPGKKDVSGTGKAVGDHIVFAKPFQFNRLLEEIKVLVKA